MSFLWPPLKEQIKDFTHPLKEIIYSSVYCYKIRHRVQSFDILVPYPRLDYINESGLVYLGKRINILG